MTRSLQSWFLTTALVAASAASAFSFELTSPDIADGGTIASKHVYNQHGCDGLNLSPALHWSAPPAGAKSFAVLVHDPDARGGLGFWHWFVYDLPATTEGLPEEVGAHGESLPAGAAQIATDFGVAAYGGPCPPKGDKPHHYHFTVYALKSARVDMPSNATAAQAEAIVARNALDKAGFIATYGR